MSESGFATKYRELLTREPEREPMVSWFDGETSLSEKQELALTALLLGARVDEAAEEAGVARETVSRWRNHDPAFMAELRRRQAELWGEARDQLRGLAACAVTCLRERLSPSVAYGKDVWTRENEATAVHVLRALGLYGKLTEEPEPTDVSIPEDATEEEAVEVFRHSFRRQREATAAREDR